jgi:hypothetical protein
MSVSRAARSRPPRRPSLVFAAAVALAGLATNACHQEEPVAAEHGQYDNQSLIGGFAANDTRLDGSGSMVIVWPYGFTDLLCSAALLTPESVLTAKHCADAISMAYSFGAKVAYAVGPDSRYPRQMVEVVAFETAPGDEGGFVGYGRDVAVLHLDRALDAPTVDVAGLSDEDLGSAFAAIGFGVQDNGGSYGTRRVGKQSLRGREGKIFEVMFGSFERFLDWFLTGNVSPATFPTTTRPSPPPPMPVDGGGTGGTGGGGGGEGGSGGGGMGGQGGSGPEAGVPPDDSLPPWIIEYARMIYETFVLEKDYEVVTGGTPGEAQPCFGDSGSSLIRKVGDRFVSYGVVSGGIGSRDLICDMGTVYATFGPDTLAFIERAKQWQDPCGDLGTDGYCDENVARRCTNVAEGRRRMVEFDCGLLGMTCNTNSGQVSCDENVFGPPPPPSPRPPMEGTPALHKAVDKVFRATTRARTLPDMRE